MAITWDRQLNNWKGQCPRCNSGGFFHPHANFDYENMGADLVLCHNGHVFTVEYAKGHRDLLVDVHPKTWAGEIPAWLPEEYRDCYGEALHAQARSGFRSVVALSGMLLEAHVNSMLKTEGDKKKSLFDRLEILREQKRIDLDQFSSATLTRLTRKDVLHPQGVLAAVTAEIANETLREVTEHLERAFKYRSSRALPTAEDINQIAQEAQEAKPEEKKE